MSDQMSEKAKVKSETRGINRFNQFVYNGDLYSVECSRNLFGEIIQIWEHADGTISGSIYAEDEPVEVSKLEPATAQ